MNLSGLLNSDVATLRSAAARAVDWWVGQLATLLPGRAKNSRRPRNIVLWDQGVLRLLRKDGSSGKMSGKGARVWLVVPGKLAFRRSLDLPRMSNADLRRLVELEAERLSPLPQAETLVGIEVGRSNAAGGQCPVEVAVLPSAAAEEAVEAARRAGLTIAGLGLFDPASRTARFDFTPALRAQGLLAGARSPLLFWWSLPAFLFILNIAVLVIRDQQSLERLQAAVEQQEPATRAARVLQGRAAGFEATARTMASERRSHDVLAMLAIVSKDLPAGAWVQRFTFSARSARLVGYKGKDFDVAASFRKDQRIGFVRSNTGQLVSETPAGQPFDLTISLKGAQ
jgi:hypothetical protein